MIQVSSLSSAVGVGPKRRDEGGRGALLTVAAYIDLNAVRAGIVEDPGDCRFLRVRRSRRWIEGCPPGPDETIRTS